MDNLSAYPFWYKIVEFLQQNWAVIVPEGDGVRVYFFSDASKVFDDILFTSSDEAKAALKRNGFALFDDDPDAQEFIGRPLPPFRLGEHSNGRIYSSGRFWS